MKEKPHRVLVITGAGISAESGIPTFRDAGGYWRNHDPRTLATATAFERDPALVWQWYRERREKIRASGPNEAHRALVRWAERLPEFLLLTQNVDDLHARAQSEGRTLPGERLVQIHGDIFVSRCRRCDFRRRNPEEDTGEVPACPQCGSALRPGVIWFDEELEAREVERVEAFLSRGACDVVLVVGTTALFEYIIAWAGRAKGQNGRLIEVNPEETGLSPLANESIRSKATVGVKQLVERFVS